MMNTSKREENIQINIKKLPLEVLNRIFSSLDSKTLYNVLTTNKYLSQVAIARLWHSISLTNTTFLPYLFTFSDYYSLYYKIIFDVDIYNNQPTSIYIKDNQWYNKKLNQFFKEYKLFLSKKGKNELKGLTEYYIKRDRPCVPYYPYLNYIKNIYIENETEDEDENNLNKNENLIKAINALSNYLKYSSTFPSIVTNIENPIIGKVKILFSKLFSSNVQTIENSENKNNFNNSNDVINISLPSINIKKLLIENVYLPSKHSIQLSDDLFKYTKNIKHIDFFYCVFPYKDLLYLPIYCSSIKTILLEHVNYDEYILLCYLYQLKKLKHFGFSLNKPFSPFTLYLLENEYNINCLSKLKSLRLNNDKDLLLYKYNNEELISSNNLQEDYISYLRERRASNTSSLSNNNINDNDNINDNENNNIENNNIENNNIENNNIENNNIENNNINNNNNNNEVNNENNSNDDKKDDNINEYISPDENLSHTLSKYYNQFKFIINSIEKRNNHTLSYEEIKDLSIDLDKFSNLMANPGYHTWKIIAKSCHNLTRLTLSFSVRLTILKSFFINNPNLEVVIIQDIKLNSRSSTNELSNSKWDNKIQEKEDKNNFSTFPILSKLKSLILHSSYTYRLWFNISEFNGWLKKLPNIQELKLYIIEPIPKYFYNIHSIIKDCYSIENLVISGPWFNSKCIKTLIENEVNNKNINHHLKSLTISLNDDVEPNEIKNLICKTNLEKFELNVHPNFDIKKLYNSSNDFDFSSLKKNKSTYCLFSSDIKTIKLMNSKDNCK